MNWEYHSEKHVPENKERYKQLGKEGWEMCGFDSSGLAWFKRKNPYSEFADFLIKARREHEEKHGPWIGGR